MRRQVRIVEARDHGAVERHFVREVDERLLQVVEAAVVLQVFVVDVRNHGNRRKQFQKRSIALVRLGHHQLAAVRAARCCRRRSAARRSPPSDRDPPVRAPARSSTSSSSCRARRRPRSPYCRRISSASISARGITGICRRAASTDLRVRRAHRRRDHHDVRVADVRGVVPVGDANPQRRQPLGHRRPLLVRPADRVAEIGQQFGDAAHADAADPDEMHAPRFA